MNDNHISAYVKASEKYPMKTLHLRRSTKHEILAKVTYQEFQSNGAKDWTLLRQAVNNSDNIVKQKYCASNRWKIRKKGEEG